MSSLTAHADAIRTLIPPTNEHITHWLLQQLPRAQWDQIMEQDYYAAKGYYLDMSDPHGL